MNKANMISDEDIIELYWQRDESAIESTDTKYGKMLFRIAYKILNDTSLSDECKSDTYLGVWNAIPPTRPRVFPAFISRIMRNTAIKRYDEMSAGKRVPSEMTVSIEELNDFLHDNGTPESEFAARELGRAISEYLRTLSERERYIFIGRFYMAETLEHLAKRLKLGIGTVHRSIEKIKRGLKAHLEGRGFTL